LNWKTEATKVFLNRGNVHRFVTANVYLLTHEAKRNDNKIIHFVLYHPFHYVEDWNTHEGLRLQDQAIFLAGISSESDPDWLKGNPNGRPTVAGNPWNQWEKEIIMKLRSQEKFQQPLPSPILADKPS